MLVKGKAILTSFGLSTKTGYELLKGELKKDGDLSEKVIFLFYEPYLSLHEHFLRACIRLGFAEDNILCSEIDKWPDRRVDYIFVGEGNTFESMRLLRDKGLFDKVRHECMDKGATYLGASAGAIIAGNHIRCAKVFDKEITRLEDWEKTGLGLLDGLVFPHVACMEELSGIDIEVFLKAENGKMLMPYLIANDGIVVIGRK